MSPPWNRKQFDIRFSFALKLFAPDFSYMLGRLSGLVVPSLICSVVARIPGWSRSFAGRNKTRLELALCGIFAYA